MIPDKILEKPGYIKNLNIFKSDKPLAGRFSEIGEKVFAAGTKDAHLIYTGPWNEIQMKDSAKQLAEFERTFPKHPHQKKWEPADNN